MILTLTMQIPVPEVHGMMKTGMALDVLEKLQLNLITVFVL